LINAQKVLASFILDSPETRYRKMLAQQPSILQRVPLQDLATYLGITPVSLSRIRKRILESAES
ncbi:MAG: Crp/Fnr family transcriptional regulator, partial [Bacteroidota bacterium]